MSNRQSRDRGEARSRQIDRFIVGPVTTDRFVGRVIQVDAGKAPGPGRYVLVRAIDVGGPEVEGGPITRTVVDPSPIPVAILDGTVAVGDDLIVRRSSGGRWESRKGGSANPYSTGITLQNCFCTVPAVLSMVSGDPTCNYGMFQSCTIAYGPPPPAMVAFGYTANVFTSSAMFHEPITGSDFFYHFSCTYNQFFLSRIFPTSPFGSPYRDGYLYNWIVGSVNTCDPFSLRVGTAFPGSDASCSVQITGATA